MLSANEIFEATGRTRILVTFAPEEFRLKNAGNEGKLCLRTYDGRVTLQRFRHEGFIGDLKHIRVDTQFVDPNSDIFDIIDPRFT